MTTKQTITDEMLNETIEMLPAIFDSHAVIRDLMRRYPREYVTDLYGHVANEDPILSYHATIGTRLTRIEKIERTKRVASPNVRGESTENQEWKKKS